MKTATDTQYFQITQQHTKKNKKQNKVKRNYEKKTNKQN